MLKSPKFALTPSTQLRLPSDLHPRIYFYNFALGLRWVHTLGLLRTQGRVYYIINLNSIFHYG